MLHAHQQKAYKSIKKKVTRYGLALFVGETRSGKTRSLLNLCKDYKNPLFITKKNAISGIYSEALEMGGIHPLTVINYHAVPKHPGEYDLIVCDEAHLYISNATPKRSQLWKDVKALAPGADMVFASGTPTSETVAKLFNMLALSDHSPWSSYKRFTLWHEDYGRLYTMKLNGYNVKMYDRVKDEKILADVEHLTVTMTRKEAGHKHEATDTLVDIPMSKKQNKFYRKLQEDQLIEKEDIIADTPVKLMQKLHQIAGGFVKREDGTLYSFKRNPKLEWLKENIDPDNTFILANYIAEQQMLAEHFPHTGSLQKLSAGVDLSMYENMIIYSMNFSAATYEQVRSRQMNIKRDTPIEIKYLCSGLDRKVYAAVQAKKNFTARWFR